MTPNRCIFCLDEQRSPRWIPCGHSFCGDCFERYLQLGLDKRCPLCRREFQPAAEPPDGNLYDIDIDTQSDTLVLTLTEQEFRLFEELYCEAQREQLEQRQRQPELELERETTEAFVAVASMVTMG